MTTNDLTKGSVVKSLFKLSIPIVMANFLHTAYQLTDTFWVGRLGSNEVAALSMAFPVIFLTISLGGGFAVSGTILVAQYAGQGKADRVSKICFQTLLVIICTSLILSVIGYWVIPYIIQPMTKSPEIARLGISYLRITFVGLVFSYFYMMFQSLYRGVGDVKTPFYIVLFSVLLNFLIDPLLINGYKSIPAFGVDGAAYATIFTQALSAFIGLYLLAKGKGGIKLNFKKPEIDFYEIRRIIELGLPASAEQSTRSLAMLVMTFLVSSFGDVVLASYGIGIRVLSFAIIPCLGFSMATSTLVGQNIGAGQKERAFEVVKLSISIIFVSMSFAGAMFFGFAKETLEFFVPTDANVIAEGTIIIKYIAVTFGFIGVQQVVAGALRGGGSTLLAMFIAIISLWVLRFPVAYFLSTHTDLGKEGIYLSFIISSVLTAIISLCVIYRKRWIKDLTRPIELKEKEVLEATITEKAGPQ